MSLVLVYVKENVIITTQELVLNLFLYDGNNNWVFPIEQSRKYFTESILRGHWTAHTIGCENSRITTQTITQTLNTEGNFILDDHLN